MVTDEQAEKAADFIRDNAENFANAKAERIFAEEYRKSMKAIIFSEMEGNVSEREHKSYAEPRYTDHLEYLKKCVFNEERLRGLIKAAEMKIELWRSQSANLRGKI